MGDWAEAARDYPLSDGDLLTGPVSAPEPVAQSDGTVPVLDDEVLDEGTPDDWVPETEDDPCLSGDDVAGCSDTPPVSIVFSDDFDSGMSAWDATGDWSVEPPVELAIPDQPADITVAQAAGCSGCTMISPVLETEGAQQLLISFYRFLDAAMDEDGSDYLELWVFSGDVQTLVRRWDAERGDTDDVWHHETLDVTAHAHANFRVGFFAGSSSSGEDVHIDDVVLTMARD